MDAALERLVRQRAGGRCEYCRLPQAWTRVPFEFGNIIPRKHRGRTIAGSPAFSCYYCNRHKGPNLAGIDPETNQIVSLFNPREDRRSEHFASRGTIIIGLTPVGRATVHLLVMNLDDILRTAPIWNEGTPT
jgi:hypothetical protein